MAKLTLNFPNMPDGAELEIVGLGLFKNGSTTEVESLESDLTLPETEATQLEEKTVEELKEIAKQRKVEGYSSLKKDELIETITEQEGGK